MLVADFTVMVGHLPPDVTEQELEDHFTRVLGRAVAEASKRAAAMKRGVHGGRACPSQNRRALGRNVVGDASWRAVAVQSKPWIPFTTGGEPGSSSSLARAMVAGHRESAVSSVGRG